MKVKIQQYIQKFNLQACIESLTYLGCACFLVYFVISQKYLQYISPKTKPYFYFTIIIMFLWGIARLKDLFSIQYKMKVMNCLVVIIPVLFVFLPHTILSSADFTSDYLKNDVIVANNYLDTIEKNTVKSKSSRNVQNIGNKKMLNPDLTGIDFSTKTIIVSEEEFYPWIIELFSNSAFYEGYTIQITGFVFKGNTAYLFSENEFVPARMVMFCCVADMSPVGIKSVYEGAETLTLDSWVTVTGTISLREERGTTIPILNVEKVETAEEPTIPFIYPNL